MSDDPLAYILEREARVKAALIDPAVVQVDIGHFFPQQLGLETALVGPDGRIWATMKNSPGALRLVFDPNNFAPRQFLVG